MLGDAESGIAAPFCRQSLSGLARRRRPAEQRDKGRGWGNRPQKQIEQLLQLQNCLFLILTGIVLCGTAAPILFQLFSDRDVTTGAPFFNGTIVPLVCCILLMLIFVHCLMLQFSKLKASLLPRKRQFTPKIPGVFAQFVYNFMEGLKLSKTSVDYRLACFVLVAITMIFVHFFAFYFVAEFSVLESTYCVLCFTLFCILFLSTSKIGVLGRLGAGAPLSRSGAPYRSLAYGPTSTGARRSALGDRRSQRSLGLLMSAGDRRSASFLLASSSNLRAPMASNMKIAHMGFLVFITGVLLSNRKKTHCSLQMRSSFELRLGHKICCLRSIDQNVGPTFRSICGNVIIYQQRLKPSRSVEPFPPTDLKQLQDAFVMFPETRFCFSNPELSTTKVAIHTNLLSDIYMLIGTGSTDSGWFVTTMQLPYIFCIWLGFLLAAIAGFNSIALLLKQQRLNWA
jgi:cytochrome c biogenesis factor